MEKARKDFGYEPEEKWTRENWDEILASYNLKRPLWYSSDLMLIEVKDVSCCMLVLYVHSIDDRFKKGKISMIDLIFSLMVIKPYEQIRNPYWTRVK